MGQVLGVAGGIVQARGQIQAGKFNQRIANLNAQFADIEAKDAIDRGKINESIQRKKIKNFKGKQRAAFGASGVDVNEGSAVDVLETTAGIGELDALTIRSNSEREAFRHRQNAFSLRAQGRQARRAGKNRALGTLLSTAGKFASQQGKK